MLNTQPFTIPNPWIDPNFNIQEFNKRLEKLNKEMKPLEIKAKIDLNDKEIQLIHNQFNKLKKSFDGRVDLKYTVDPIELNELDQTFRQLSETYNSSINLSDSVMQLSAFTEGTNKIIVSLQNLESQLQQIQGLLSENTPILQGFFRAIAVSAASDVVKDSIKKGASSFSKEIATISSGSAQMTKSLGTASVASGVLRASTTALTVSLRALSSAFLPLAIISGVSLAIEGLVALFGKQKKKQEELTENNRRLKEEQDQIASIWGREQENIRQLTAEYGALRSIKERSVEEEHRYLQISEDLAALMPSLVSHTDELGKTHLKSAEAIQAELEYAEQLYKLNKEAYLLDAPDMLGGFQKDIKATEKKINSLKRDIDKGYILAGHSLKFFDEKELNELKRQLAELEKDHTIENLHMRKELVQITEIKLEADEITIDENISSFLHDFFKEVDTTIPKDKLMEMSSDIAQFITDIQRAMSSGQIGWEQDVERIVEQFNKAYPELESSIQNLSSSIVNSARVANDVLYPVYDENKNKIGEIKDITDEAAKAFGHLSPVYNDSTKAIIGYTTAVENLAEKTWDNVTATELLLGINTDHYKQIMQAIEVVQLLSQMENLNTEQKGMLAGATEFLENLYPHLSGRISENIEFLFEEAQMLDLLSTQSGSTAEALINNQDEATINTLDAIKSRISAYEDEIKALQEVVNATNWTQGNDMQISPEAYDTLTKHLSRIRELNNKIAEEQEERRKIIFGSGLITRPSSTGSGSDSNSTKAVKEEKLVDPYEIDQYADSIQYLDTAIKLAEGQMSRLSKTSDKYSKSLNDQIYYLNLKQQKIAEQGKNLDTQISELNAQLAITKEIEEQNELKKQIESLTSERRSLSTSWWDVDQEKYSKIFERQMITFEQLNKKLEEHDHHLEMSQALQEKNAEGTEDWNKALLEQSKTIRAKREVLLEQINVLEALLETNKLLPPQEEEVQKQLRATKLEYEKLGNTLKDQQETLKRQREKIADDVIAVYKEVYQKQKDLALKAIDEEVKALEKAHRQRMDYLDAELKKYEDIVNAKLRALDDQASEEDYTKQLVKEQEKLQEIQDRIDILALDNSLEAAAQRAELEKQLAEQKEKIEDMQLNRSRELQKQHLQDQLDNYRKDVDGKKQAEQHKYDQERARLEQTRKDTEYHFNELINNEREFARIKEEIMAGNITNLKSQLEGFVSEFKRVNQEAARDIGQSYEELLNIIDRVNDVTGAFDGISHSIVQNGSGNRDSAWQTYLNNKKKAEELFRQTGKWDESLRSRNELLRIQYDFQDGSYDKLKNLKEYHTGGVIGGTSNRITSLVDKLFNTRPNEEVVKMLKGELAIPAHHISNNFLPNMGNLISSIQPQSSTDAVAINRIEFRIDKLLGGKQGAETLINSLVTGLKMRGVNI